MNNILEVKDVRRRFKLQPAFWMMAITALIAAAACGGETKHTTMPGQYAAGSMTEDDIRKQLEYDSRVESYDTEDNNRLVVNVNGSWTASPPGMRERAIGQWYSMWRAARGNNSNLEVVVRHEGADVAKYSSKDGYQPIIKPSDKSNT